MIVHAAGWLILACGLFFLGDRFAANYHESGPDFLSGSFYGAAIGTFLAGVVLLITA